jgi:hypothetical protein
MEKKFYLLFNTVKGTGYSGECLDAKYDMGHACPNCGTGYKLIGNLPVKAVKFQKEFIETLDQDYLISEKLYSELNSAGVKMDTLLRVINFKSKEELPYYHFNPELNFPKLLPESEGIVTDEQCPICKRNGFFDHQVFPKDASGEVIVDQVGFVSRKYKYSSIDKTLFDQSDVFFTWEHFGYSRLKSDGKYVIRYARPRLIVSEIVKKVFEDQKIKNALFEEISFKG